EHEHRLNPGAFTTAMLNILLDRGGSAERGRAHPCEPLDRVRIVATAQVRHSASDLNYAPGILRLEQIHAARADRDVVIVAVSPLDVVPDSPPFTLEPPQSTRRLALPFGALVPPLHLARRSLSDSDPHPG